LEWIENVATEFTALLALLDDRGASAEEEYVESLMAGINSKLKDF
jgi:hypothetical protein